MNETKISIPSLRLAQVLALIATLLAIQSILLRTLQYRIGTSNTYWLYQYGELMNINREANVPTWFSASLLLGAALLLLTITLTARANERPYLGWAGLTAIFSYMSMDEAGTIHEKLTPILQEQLGLTGYLYFGWVIAGVAAILVVGLVFLPFVWRLPSRTRRWFILAGLLYVGGAVVVESISANVWYIGGGTSLRFSAIGTVEEWLEMLGVITLHYGLLEYIRTHVGVVQFSVRQAVTASAQEKEPKATEREALRTTASA